MDKYTELKEIVSKLTAMNEDNNLWLYFKFFWKRKCLNCGTEF